MNDITVFIFGISFAAVVGATFAFMWSCLLYTSDAADE